MRKEGEGSSNGGVCSEVYVYLYREVVVFNAKMTGWGEMDADKECVKERQTMQPNLYETCEQGKGDQGQKEGIGIYDKKCLTEASEGDWSMC